MAKFYVQLEDKLLKISGDLTVANISKALGYVPVSPNAINELSQRVDNITFDSLKDNPFLQDGSGELNIVDEAGNIIAKIDAEGIHSVDFIAGEHRLSNKTDKTYVDEAVKNVKVDLTGYATEEWVENKNYLTEHQDISHLATKDEIPTKASDLDNDSNYLTEHQDISHLATKDEVSNIDFYNIKDNPIVNNGDGKLLFVDENGYIGLQLEEDGLYVKDVIADGHTLSQKADKSELSNYATKDEVSDLVDMSVVTELQGKVDTLVGEDSDKSVRDIAVDVLTETLVSETATEAYDTLAEMSAWIKSHPEDAAAMNTAIQKNATDIQSNTTAISNLDAAYKAADTKVLTDAQEYTDNINFYTIKDNPIVDNNDGNLTFVDETGNIGLQFSNNAILVNDVITPEHTLSSKQNVLISGANIKTVNGESILGSGDITISGGGDANVQAVDTGETLDDVSGVTYVKYVAQTLTDEQKAQARANIGAEDALKLKINGKHITPENGIVDLNVVETSMLYVDDDEFCGAVIPGLIVNEHDGAIYGLPNTLGYIFPESAANDELVAKSYVDGLVGDINSVLESIISGGPSINLISITVNDSYTGTSYVCQAEEGMTWVDWINSKYNTYGWYRNYGYIFLSDNIVLAFQGGPFTEPTLTEYVMEDGAVGFHTYNLDPNN